MSSSDDMGSFATAGSGKSEAEVAFDLLNKLKGQGVWGERNMADILDMYAECLDAAKGLRAYKGQTRIDAPIQDQSSSLQAAQPVVAAPRQAPPQAAPAQPLQTAHAQQQHLQNVYNNN